MKGTKTKFILGLFAIAISSPAVGFAAVQNDASLFPPNAEPGKCYAKVLIPPNLKKVTEEVLQKEATEKITVTPPKWEWVEEKVVVKAAEEKLELIPATFKTVEEKIEIVPSSVKLVVTEPTYETVEEKVLDKPARTVWKRGTGLLDKVDNATGDIMCLVNEPATYKLIQKQVVKAKASVNKVDVPGKYKIVKKQVIDKPAEVKKYVVPAKYITIKVKKLVSPAKTQIVKIPEERQTISKYVKETDEKMSWRPVLCQTNMTKDVIVKVQNALKDKGFDPGPVDGAIGGGTLKALRDFQVKMNLARGGLTYETLDALNVFVK